MPKDSNEYRLKVQATKKTNSVFEFSCRLTNTGHGEEVRSVMDTIFDGIQSRNPMFAILHFSTLYVSADNYVLAKAYEEAISKIHEMLKDAIGKMESGEVKDVSGYLDAKKESE